jgi:hypothetical protein
MGNMVNSKSLFPIIEGLDENPKSLVTYSICSNGIFMTKKVCGRGTVTTKIEGIKALPEGKEDINILPRKIPISYFWKIVEFFRYVAKILPEKAEAYILLGYSFDEDKFCLYVPKHDVTGASVKYDIEAFWTDNPGYYCILDTHLHPSFSAFWSGTDNEDDKRDRFSMVIGKQDLVFPEYQLRFSAGKQHIDFKVDDLFDNSIEEIDFDCAKAIKNIKLHKPEIQGYIMSGNSGGYSLYNSMKFRIKKEFTIPELMGKDW